MGRQAAAPQAALPPHAVAQQRCGDQHAAGCQQRDAAPAQQRLPLLRHASDLGYVNLPVPLLPAVVTWSGGKAEESGSTDGPRSSTWHLPRCPPRKPAHSTAQHSTSQQAAPSRPASSPDALQVARAHHRHHRVRPRRQLAQHEGHVLVPLNQQRPDEAREVLRGRFPAAQHAD